MAEFEVLKEAIITLKIFWKKLEIFAKVEKNMYKHLSAFVLFVGYLQKGLGRWLTNTYGDKNTSVTISLILMNLTKISCINEKIII